MSTLVNEPFLRRPDPFVKRQPAHSIYVDELRSHKHNLARVTSWTGLPKIWVLVDTARVKDVVRQAVDAHQPPADSRAALIEERRPRRAVSEHVQQELVSLVHSRAVPPLAAVRALKELLFAIPADAVYPHVAADENGEVAFYWFAGTSRLEILVPEHGEIYYRASGLSKGASFEGFCRKVPVEKLRSAIGEITKRVTESNPDWQRVFGE